MKEVQSVDAALGKEDVLFYFLDEWSEFLTGKGPQFFSDGLVFFELAASVEGVRSFLADSRETDDGRFFYGRPIRLLLFRLRLSLALG